LLFKGSLHTLKLFHCFHPIVLCMTTFSAFYTYFKAIILKSIPTGLLIWKFFNKIYKLHIQYFESKLLPVTVTYLRFDIGLRTIIYHFINFRKRFYFKGFFTLKTTFEIISFEWLYRHPGLCGSPVRNIANSFFETTKVEIFSEAL
jgi:hypothetical protein